MKFSEKWLREWVNPSCSTEELSHVLTMAGLEVDSCELNNLDNIIEIDLTPNRGDCLSIRGIARDVAACTQTGYTPLKIAPVSKVNPDLLMTLNVNNPEHCPRYLGRVIKNINIKAQTPDWIQNRLISSGLKTINCIVDVMNYVMLELGQPMHAFDLEKINQSIVIREAQKGEKILTLDDQIVELNRQELVIADSTTLLAIAGVMGGLDSAVSDQTQSVFLESAFFSPFSLAGVARKLGLHTDSAFRFERGVDFNLPQEAIERATALILDIAGGETGPIIEKTSTEHLPKIEPISLNYHNVIRLLGQEMSSEQITSMLIALGCEIKQVSKLLWEVTPASFRFDLKIEEDLIEEICRVIGYDNVPLTMPSSYFTIPKQNDTQVALGRLKRAWVDLGYSEAITYSFVSPTVQALCTPELPNLVLENPISSEMSVMRASLWPGLIGALQHNQARNQSNIRFFESGLRFRLSANNLIQEQVLSGIAVGAATPIHWQEKARALDFYDIKGHIETVFKLTGRNPADLQWEPCDEPEYAALHPGQSAKLLYKNNIIGVMGVLHPAIVQELSLEGKVIVFELILDLFSKVAFPNFSRPSKYPAIGRDISFTLKVEQPVGELVAFIKNKFDKSLQDVVIFDIYSGQGIDSGRKSVAIALTFQHTERTLVEDEIDVLMQSVVSALKSEFGAQLRD